MSELTRMQKQIRDLTRAGRAPREIAKVINRTPRYVRSVVGHFREHGLLPKPGPRTLPAVYHRIMELAGRGHPARIIAAAIGVKRRYVHGALQRMRKIGVLPRPVKEPLNPTRRAVLARAKLGEPPRTIAKRLGLDRRYVNTVVVDLRARGFLTSVGMQRKSEG